ncbi:MAG TPA: UDP-N-acetylmuramoyl-L-alanine--D-glutamate ligase [Candidatus Binataceae bacterium]|jgi:UDP-N-acetylmuramoylalanine--D-glutamate ligase|nr:UDP-N-acetylmuramoyl-L-alanine--D-glutamate ligase [Candidatus Binataceae bacterium]
MELRGKRVMVVGLGVSGAAAAHFLHARGASLVLSDVRRAMETAALPPGELRLGGEDPAWLGGVELVVASPGVPPASALLAEADRRGIPVIGELELGGRFVRAPIVAVTGTNGKSTVTTLVAEILKAAGRRVFVGGNLGTPLVEAAGLELDAVVVEVSSFQLERIASFKPHVAVHLNLAEDHLDRYRDFADYARTKARLFLNQDRADWAVLNRDDPMVWRLRSALAARVMSFGLGPAASAAAIGYDGRDLIFDDGGRRAGRISLAQFRLAGRHNVANAMAAAGAALAMGVEPAAIEAALATFRALPHRMEFVDERAGVAWIDDSKGTNVASVVEALAATRAPVILIAGGMDKGGDYAPLRAPLKEKVRLLILIGAARDKMRAALEGATQIELRQTLDEAVRCAAAAARGGDTVLLSPACSSFDQFRSYAERGRIFQELVRAL